MNPQFTEFYNLTYLYSMPYDKITIDPLVNNFELKIIVYLNDREKVMYYKLKPNPDLNLRENTSSVLNLTLP